MLNPNKIRQFLAFAIVVAVLSLAGTIGFRMYMARQRVDTSLKIRPTADVSMQKLHYSETRKGKKQWDLVAERADYDKTRDVARLNKVQLVVAGEPATGDVTLTAEQADYHTKSGDVELSGNVVARSASGLEFTAPTVKYQTGRGLIVTKDPVRFSEARLTVEGTGMELAVDSRRIKVKGGVTAVVTPEVQKQ